MIRNIIIAGLILIGLTYCRKPNKEEIQQVKDQEKFDETTAAIAERFEGMVTKISVSELSANLQSLGADFNDSFINDPANVESYTSNEIKAASNLGVYYVDMNFVAAYDKRDLAVALYSSAQSLSENLGVGRFFNQTVLARFEESMTAEGKAAVQNSLQEASKNLRIENRPRISGIVLAAVLIERLHLVGAIIDQTRDLEGLSDEERSLLVTPAMRAAVQQKDNFKNVVEYLATVRNADDPNPIFWRNLNSINNEFADLDAIKDQLDRTETVDPALLNGLFASVDEARAQIVATSAE
jgi:hypothetical protein